MRIANHSVAIVVVQQLKARRVAISRAVVVRAIQRQTVDDVATWSQQLQSHSSCHWQLHCQIAVVLPSNDVVDSMAQNKVCASHSTIHCCATVAMCLLMLLLQLRLQMPSHDTVIEAATTKHDSLSFVAIQPQRSQTQQQTDANLHVVAVAIVQHQCRAMHDVVHSVATRDVVPMRGRIANRVDDPC